MYQQFAKKMASDTADITMQPTTHSSGDINHASDSCQMKVPMAPRADMDSSAIRGAASLKGGKKRQNKYESTPIMQMDTALANVFMRSSSNVERMD